MGCSKNYIMYWGGYVYYNSIGRKISVHKHESISNIFLCITRTPLFSLAARPLHFAQKPGLIFRRPGFLSIVLRLFCVLFALCLAACFILYPVKQFLKFRLPYLFFFQTQLAALFKHLFMA